MPCTHVNLKYRYFYSLQEDSTPCITRFQIGYGFFKTKLIGEQIDIGKKCISSVSEYSGK